ncbi:hypothetical protein NADFUDRAFT_42674 [Nadsonia fulvescens var. elongata DSM 6958]|uniref:Uncharacterized protein n=1 Tax=Nadsonia fulvescens var. elongata DSM 6958 TaxID=857566 RepID=A0A1E3PIZ7_9ASCO|nr:hypothetical protein NADFUDRAFT_42674 [Nadsonia fulvescens var. elongata DSM 6958]
MSTALVGYSSDSNSESETNPSPQSPPLKNSVNSIESLISNEQLWLGTDSLNKLKEKSSNTDNHSETIFEVSSPSNASIDHSTNTLSTHFNQWYTPLRDPEDDTSDSMSKNEISQEIGLDDSLQYMQLADYMRLTSQYETRKSTDASINYHQIEPESYGDTILDNINRLNRKKRKIDQLKNNE